MKFRCEHSNLKSGDWIRVQRPFASHKLESYLSKSIKIARMLTRNTVLLENDFRWKDPRCILVKQPPTTEDSDKLDVILASATERPRNPDNPQVPRRAQATT